MKAAVWARVSTEDQDTENQVRQLREWAAARGYEVTRAYVLNDSAWLGGKENGEYRANLQSGEG